MVKMKSNDREVVKPEIGNKIEERANNKFIMQINARKNAPYRN